MERYFWHTHISPNSNFTLPSGHKACGNDLATWCAPAHYTLHHLHITWRDNTCWSFSRRFKRVQQGSFIETIKTALLQRLFPKEQTVLQWNCRVCLCQTVSAALWFQSAPRKLSNQHLCMLFTSFSLLLLWLCFISRCSLGHDCSLASSSAEHNYYYFLQCFAHLLDCTYFLNECMHSLK